MHLTFSGSIHPFQATPSLELLPATILLVDLCCKLAKEFQVKKTHTQRNTIQTAAAICYNFLQNCLVSVQLKLQLTAAQSELLQDGGLNWLLQQGKNDTTKLQPSVMTCNGYIIHWYIIQSPSPKIAHQILPFCGQPLTWQYSSQNTLKTLSNPKLITQSAALLGVIKKLARL